MDLHGKTVAFVGCGTLCSDGSHSRSILLTPPGAMGSALLQGLLESSPCKPSKDGKGPMVFDHPFIACTKTAKSATLLAESFSQYNAQVRVVHGNAVQTAKEVDVVILGFKPFMVREVFAVPGFLDALEGKLVVSMLAGLTCSELQGLVRSQDGTTDDARTIHFARALPTIACRHRQSMTILESSTPALSAEHTRTLETLFGSVGNVQYLAPHLINIGCMLATASLATLSVPVEGLLDGAVAEGLRRSEARDI